MTDTGSTSNDRWADEADWGEDALFTSGHDNAANPAPSPPLPARPVPAARAATVAPTPAPAPADDEEQADDAEYFPGPRRGRALLGFLAFLIVLAGIAYAGLTWYKNQVDPPGPAGREVTYVIPSNTSTARIGKLLHAEGIIGNPTLFRYYAQYKGKGGFEAGRYVFHKHDSFDNVIRTLSKGPTVPESQKITIPEGFRITQIAARVGAKLPGRTNDKFLAATTSGKVRSTYQPEDSTNLEGFLFPDTYTFALDEDETTVVSRMVETFDQVAEGVALADSAGTVGLSPYETLILASLVEREAKHDKDRPKIARVIFNRLKEGMPLQIDATLVYALGGVTRVLDEDLKLDSPFNSYTRKGLPPAPIASPGKASLEAALHPEVGEWLFYVVTTPDGHHSFATTFKEHKANIKLAKERGLR